MKKENAVRRRKSILFIDDDPDYVESMKPFLEKKYEVVTAFSAEEGWKEARRKKPDLIVLDAMMKPENGFVMARALKTDPAYRDVPVIMLTGIASADAGSGYSKDHVLRYEGDEFIEKSGGMKKVLPVIDGYLETGTL